MTPNLWPSWINSYKSSNSPPHPSNHPIDQTGHTAWTYDVETSTSPSAFALNLKTPEDKSISWTSKCQSRCSKRVPFRYTIKTLKHKWWMEI